MWVIAMFDLPVQTKQQRYNYRKFVEFLEDDGYQRMQYSVFARACASEENADVHAERLRRRVPDAGEVRLLKLTDKQWGRTMIFRTGLKHAPELPPEQFTFFETPESDVCLKRPPPETCFQGQADVDPPVPLIASKRGKKKLSASGQFQFFSQENDV
jgi:CRISPR-associated protein Cas2